MEKVSKNILCTFILEWLNQTNLIKFSINIKSLRKIKNEIKINLTLHPAELFILKIFPSTYSLKLIKMNNYTNLYSLQLLNLITLNLSGCFKITDNGIKYLAAQKSLKILTTLNLYYCYEITDEGIKYISNSFKLLTTLNIGSCFKITNKGISYLSKLNKLTILNLSSLHEISDVAFKYLKLKSLISLNISSCKITDDGLKYFLQLQSLTILNVFFVK